MTDLKPCRDAVLKVLFAWIGSTKSKTTCNEIADEIMAVLSPTATCVYTVYRSDDQSNHIFSTEEKAKEYASSVSCPCVVSYYIVDEPEKYYGEKQ